MLIFFESSLALKMGSKNREFRERAVVETFSSFLGAMQAYDTIPDRAGSSRLLTRLNLKVQLEPAQEQ